MTDRLLTSRPPGTAAVSRSGRRWPVRLGVALLAAVGTLHVWAVWSTYHVGSFDDDGHYVALGRALASGLGFVDTSLPGDPVERNRPPGPALLYAPVAALSPDTTWQFQAVSVLMFVACFPLLWHWMRLRGFGPASGLLVLALLALNPVAATYGAMVMVEMPFLVTLLGTLIALHHWERQDRAATRWGLAAVALLAWLLSLKSAAFAFYPGVVGYLVLRRRLRKAALATVAGILVLVPVAATRMVHGVSLLGRRDSGYFAQYGEQPLRVLQVLPGHLYDFASYALPDSIVPVAHVPSVFPALPGLLFALRPVVTVLVVVGFVAWHRDHGLDPTVVIAPLYLAQSLSYPFINERRVVLILPLVLVWLLVGARVSSAGVGRLWSAAPAAVRRGTQRGGRWRPLAGPVALTLCAAVLVPLLTVQFGRNYRLPAGLETSKLQGSSYVHALRAITESHEDIASSYRWAVAAFTHRDTLNTVHFHPCGGSPGSENVHAGKLELLRAHTYGAVLLGALNTPWGFDDRCTLRVLEQNPAWAVRIHRQPRDKAIVFQLIGPGTANPALSDVTRARPVHASGATLREEREPPYVAGEASGRYHILEPTGQTRDRATLTVPFHGPAPVTQVSLGAAGQPVGAADSIAVELRATDGRWIRAWSARGVDVDTREQGPDIVVRGFDTPATATAVRVAFRGRGPFEVHDLHVLARTGHRDEPALE